MLMHIGVSVEAELGTVGGQEDDVIADGVIYADPEECEELVKEQESIVLLQHLDPFTVHTKVNRT